MSIQPIEWFGNKVKILDQTRLPQKEVYIETDDYKVVASAIKKLQVRGAPAIGVAGAYGIALGALAIETESNAGFLKKFQRVSKTIAGTRPTARNLFFAVERMEEASKHGKNADEIKANLIKEAIEINKEEAEATFKLSELGAGLIKDGFTILTHCNAGPLATTGYGTALGVIIRAHEQGKKIKVFADETRPLLQGARLTVWELQKTGIPVTLITDNMAGYFMNQGKIDCVIVGADRITANGDTANKIGTYSVAVLAKENNIPFYVAAPVSTIDPSLKTGKEIPIEERKANEVTHIRGYCIVPDCTVANPAFDVTPSRYIKSIITERGIISPPLGMGIKKVVQGIK
jgi:methylthioribose-1-phosphate isomerase